MKDNKHGLYDYLKLGLENSKAIAAVWLLLITSFGANIYGVVDAVTTPDPQKVIEQPELIKLSPSCNAICGRIMQEHVIEYH